MPHRRYGQPDPIPSISLQRLREIVRETFWLVPALCVLIAIVLAIGLLALDQELGRTQGVFLFPGSPSTARSFLSSIIQAMITFTGLVFSITIVVLQLTSAQFSPGSCARSCVTERSGSRSGCSSPRSSTRWWFCAAPVARAAAARRCRGWP